MKRVNLILVSEDPFDTVTAVEQVLENTTQASNNTNMQAVTIKDGDIDPASISPEVESQLRALDSTLIQYPALANDPEVKKLIDIKEGMERFAAKNANKGTGATGAAPATDTTKTDTGTAPATTTATGLENTPFFKKGEQIDLKTASLENFSEIAAKNLGVDTSKEGWFGNYIAELSAVKAEAEALRTQTAESKAILDGIEKLPAEIQRSIKAFSSGEDWRTVIGVAASTLDYTKDFSKLTPEQQIELHNYYFPEDKLEGEVDVKDKTVSKSLKAVESKFNADKQTYENNLKIQKQQAIESDKAFFASIDASKAAFAQAYPEFDATELARVDNVIRKQGVASLLFDKDGNALPDTFEKVAFMLNGKNVLQAAVAIAKNQGRSEGKAEVLQTTNTTGGGVKDTTKKLTDEEVRANQILNESLVDKNNPY